MPAIPPDVLRVSTSVWCVRRREFLACSYVLATGDGAVLVDAGIDPTGGDMEAGLAAAGRTRRDVVGVCLTHWHNDHASGAAAYAALGARVAYHPAGAAHLRRERPPAPWRAALARRLPEHGILSALRGLLEVGPPRAVSADEDALDGRLLFGALRVLETPGHAAGHVSYWYAPERVLFAGDALAVSSGRVSFMSRWLTQDLAAARASMLRCVGTDAAAICPGHRGPLAPYDAGARERALRRLEAARPWPAYGC